MPFETDALDVHAAAGMSLDRSNSAEDYVFEGHVDFYGYHVMAGGWFFGGWVAHPWPLDRRPQNPVADFNDASAIEHTHSMFYNRADVSGRGIGYVFFFRAPPVPAADFIGLRIACGAGIYGIYPTPNVLVLTDEHLVEHLAGMLAGGEAGSQRRKMQELLQGKPPPTIATGFVDSYGHHAVAGGWMFCGWVGLGWPEGQPPDEVAIRFEDGDVVGEASAVLFPRPDLQGNGEGIACFVHGAAMPLGALCSVSFSAGPLRVSMQVAPTTARVREPELVSRLQAALGQAMPSLQRDILAGLLARRPYTGEDTLASLETAVFIEIDEAIQCDGDGLLLMGWYLSRPGDIKQVRVRSGALISELDLLACIRLERPDVVEAFAEQGFTDPRCGFITFLPRAVAPNSRVYIEVETTQREVGYRTVPRCKLEGIAAMKRVLSAVDVRFGEVPSAFDHVLGPAIEALNRRRLADRPAVTVIDYGKAPDAPKFSVIVPLYGRLDFVEYQMALFSAHPAYAETEFIYVLDDPPKRREAQFLFASVYERFVVPFRAVLLDRNVGFAPANNIGLSHARGEFVVYLNSDVFPGTPDWLERLASRLADDPTLGVIGPVLLFEDGSVQHRGMFFERVAEFGNWYFGMHAGKGLSPPGGHEVERPLSITGACMMIARALAGRVGGFDETYAIGDFEDSDLCLRLRALGYGCGIDPEVQLFHLERKSQASSSVGWRMNLTVYNAWQHERRWTDTIAACQLAPPQTKTPGAVGAAEPGA